MAAFSRADAHEVVDVFGRNPFYRRVDQASWSEVEFVSGLLLMFWFPYQGENLTNMWNYYRLGSDLGDEL